MRCDNNPIMTRCEVRLPDGWQPYTQEAGTTGVEKGCSSGRGLHIHERIKLKIPSGIIETTPGRHT